MSVYTITYRNRLIRYLKRLDRNGVYDDNASLGEFGRKAKDSELFACLTSLFNQ